MRVSTSGGGERDLAVYLVTARTPNGRTASVEMTGQQVRVFLAAAQLSAGLWPGRLDWNIGRRAS